MSLKFLYTTDLHGDKRKFEAVLKEAIEQKINLIHLGSDFLPKGMDLLKSQREFTNTFLKDFYKKASDLNIKLLVSFGNDDCYPIKDDFRKYGSLLDENTAIIEGYRFIAYGYVPNYRFRLKTACKIDYSGWVLNEKQYKDPVDFFDGKLYTIKNLDSYFKDKGTIKEDLEKINADNFTIASIHCPPNNLKLDVCGSFYPFQGGFWVKDREVGSQAIYDWAEREQPLLMLCGHIHESRLVTNTWRNKIKNTFVIQPGQMGNKLIIVKVNLNNSKVRSSLFLRSLENG